MLLYIFPTRFVEILLFFGLVGFDLFYIDLVAFHCVILVAFHCVMTEKNMCVFQEKGF